MEPVANKPPTSWKKSPVSVTLIIICVFTILAVGSNYTRVNNKKLSRQANISTINTTHAPEPTTKPTFVPIPPVEEGRQQYTNEYLRYGFSYDADDDLYECPDIICLSINTISFRLSTIDSDILTSVDPANAIFNDNLICDAGGPTGLVYCENESIETYTNPLGFTGYKINRKKNVQGSGAGVPPGTYEDVAYVFILPTVYKQSEFSNIAALIFDVENPIPSNHEELHKIVDSYFTF